MKQNGTVGELLLEFCRAWFEGRNIEDAIACLWDDVRFAGAGAGELVCGAQEMRGYLEQNLRELSEPLAFELSNVCKQAVTAEVCNLTALLKLKNTLYTRTLRVFCTLALGADGWRIKSLQLAESDGGWGKEILGPAFDSIPSGLCVYRFMGDQIELVCRNAAFLEIMGYSAEHARLLEQKAELLGVHPEDQEMLRRKVRESVRASGGLHHTCRIWNDEKGQYRWIHLEGAVKAGSDGSSLLYCVCTDVSQQIWLEKKLTDSNEKMQDIINAIPGGVAIYKVSDIFETIYFSDGVPALSGYTVEEYRELVRQDAAEMTYREDTDMVVERAMEVIRTHEIANFEFRKQHRDGHIVWVRVQIKWIGEEDGCPLLHCVFHNISDLKEAHMEMDHLVNSIPGGIASYRVEGSRFIPTYFSDGVMDLSGHTREDYRKLIQNDALDIIYEQDRERVLAAARAALVSGDVLDVSYRMRHKDGYLIWIHLNGRRMGPQAEIMRFYAVFTGMSAETRLFQSITDEMADGIYVIGKDNYDLLYVNESKGLFSAEENCIGKKCYAALLGKDSPCEFCTLKKHAPDGEEHEMAFMEDGRHFSTRFRETDWNGIPAYVKFIRDNTAEIQSKKEKERLAQYFETVLKHLPGGVAVVHYEKNGTTVPEFLSDGFAALTGMSRQEAQELYQNDVMAGVHPEDLPEVNRKMEEYLSGAERHCEIVYRLRHGRKGYVWVRNNLSIIQNEGGESRVYSMYQDMTREREEQSRIRRQYKELILQHYQTRGPDELVVGHCNITQNHILEINDYTNCGLLEAFGTVREEFFIGLGSLVVEEDERREFLDRYLNKPALEAFARGDTEQRMECFIRLPGESKGRYVLIDMNLVETPDTGGVTGILTVSDITGRTISNRILHQLSASGYDFVVDLDLTQDTYEVLSFTEQDNSAPRQKGCHSEWVAYMMMNKVVPVDRQRYRDSLDTAHMLERLKEGGTFSFAFSIYDDNGEIRTKSITVSAVDLRLGRVCLSRADITDSVRQQQGLLHVIAYTFELAGFIDVGRSCLTLYTRKTVLENLPPYFVEEYDAAIDRFMARYGVNADQEKSRAQFQISTMIKQLEDKPNGYDFLFSYLENGEERYKQVNVMWGDVNHRTICLVRADVTDMLAAERQSKKKLENALVLAEKANRAKSDFLSAMSHDIRTPMNAIMGMTALAAAYLDDRERVEDCLRKISISSRHLLSLINDILDMSKIERSQITLNRTVIFLPELLREIAAIMEPQATAAGLRFEIRSREYTREYIYGDGLRLNQILLNILSNAVKYTPEGGSVDFMMEEVRPSRNENRMRLRFTVSDTGLGMAEEFLEHVFEPFTRCANARHIEGTGLGLSITRGLVELMGGEISVESRPGNGSRFTVELEFEPAPETEGGAVENSEALVDTANRNLFAGRLFLVAEDNAINAEILCELLSMYGARTVVKTDGLKAVTAFMEAEPGTYAAVLMDIQMPEMNGYEAAKKIRSMDRPDAAVIPIVAMTANAFAEDVKTALASGMTAHVAKPVDMDVLRDTLKRVLAENGGPAGK